MFNTIVKAGMAESGDGRSCCFVARLGALYSIDRFETWASSTCSEHALVRDENGAVTMYAQRETAKTAAVAKSDPHTDDPVGNGSWENGEGLAYSALD